MSRTEFDNQIVTEEIDGYKTHYLKDFKESRGVCDFCKNKNHCFFFLKFLPGIQDANKINLMVSSCSNTICDV